MIIVPNEWLVDLLLGSEDDQRKVHRFLDRIDAGEGPLAIRRLGRLTQKILSATSDPQRRAKRLRLMLYDGSKVRLVEEGEILPLPPELAEGVSGDDLYLVETGYGVRPCMLVTTDEPLKDFLSRHSEFEIQARLLNEHLQETGG